MQELLLDKDQIDSGIQDVNYKIDNITEKELLEELSSSKIYKVTIDGQELVYKVIYKNKNMKFHEVLRSYQNLKYYQDVKGIVKVYDYRRADDDSTFEVLMEYLKDYYVINKRQHMNNLPLAKQIHSICSQVLERGILPIDPGLVNFMTDGINVKMIDLDLMLQWKESVFFHTTWSISRLRQITEWCPEIAPDIDEIIKNIVDERIKYFIPYNPLAQKLILEGENILAEDGDTYSAVKLFNKALELNRRSAAAYNNLAVAYWNLDDIERSETAIKTAAEIEPDNEIFAANYRDILSAQSKSSEANNVISRFESYMKNISAQNEDSIQNKSSETELEELQKEINMYSYPANYAYDIYTLKPLGRLVTRMEYITNFCPQLFEPCKNFLSVGSSLGYMMFFHAHHAKKCTGIEPDGKANEIVKKVMNYRDVDNIALHHGTFLDFPKNELYDLIWMGNVFQYMYLDFEWNVAKELAKISNGICVIEAPLEGSYLQTQIQYNSNWANEKLMNDYSLKRFKEEFGKYFDVVSVNPSGTDPVNRVLVVIKRNGKKV